MAWTKPAQVRSTKRDADTWQDVSSRVRVIKSSEFVWTVSVFSHFELLQCLWKNKAKVKIVSLGA